MDGMPVLGDTRQLSKLARDLSVEKVIIAIPSARGRDVREIIRRCKMAGVRFMILPGLSDLISGRVEVSQIKDVEIDDLLGREPVQLDDRAISGYLAGKRVLVTGAAGSIGSEICRQVARFRAVQNHAPGFGRDSAFSDRTGTGRRFPGADARAGDWPMCATGGLDVAFR